MSDMEDEELTPRSKKSINNRGILDDHARKVGVYNILNNWLIVFRPINPGVAKKLGEEGYKGKVIFIKINHPNFLQLVETYHLKQNLVNPSIKVEM